MYDFDLVGAIDYVSKFYYLSIWCFQFYADFVVLRKELFLYCLLFFAFHIFQFFCFWSVITCVFCFGWCYHWFIFFQVVCVNFGSWITVDDRFSTFKFFISLLTLLSLLMILPMIFFFWLFFWFVHLFLFNFTYVSCSHLPVCYYGSYLSLLPYFLPSLILCLLLISMWLSILLLISMLLLPLIMLLIFIMSNISSVSSLSICCYINFLGFIFSAFSVLFKDWFILFVMSLL